MSLAYTLKVKSHKCTPDERAIMPFRSCALRMNSKKKRLLFPSSMRKLSLHVSALNDEEYEIFTSAFSDLAMSDDYEHQTLTIREVRGWIKGRYASLDSITVDNILRLFSPNLGPADTINGSEFFAILRLTIHAGGGKQIDRSLAFIQTHPRGQYPHLFYNSASDPQPLTAPLFPVKDANQTPTQESHNPFLQLRAHRAGASSKSEDSTSARQSNPPLPPRKLMPPPRHAPASQQQSQYQYSSHPPKHAPSTLIQQSLVAQKTAQSLKKAEEMLEKERILQVLKRSSMPAVAYKAPPSPPKRNRSISPSKTKASTSSHGRETNPPPLPRRRGDTMSSTSSNASETNSPPLSANSFKEVALAGTSQVDTLPPRKPTNPFPRRVSHSSDGTKRTTSSSPTRRVPPPVHPDHHHTNSRPPPPKKPSSLSGTSVSRMRHGKRPSHSSANDDVFTSEEEEEGFYTPSENENGIGLSEGEGEGTIRQRSHGRSPFVDPNVPPVPVRKKRPESVQLQYSSSSPHIYKNVLETVDSSSPPSSPFITSPDTPTRSGSGNGVTLTRSKTSPSASHYQNGNGGALGAHKRRVSLNHAAPSPSSGNTNLNGAVMSSSPLRPGGTIQRTLDRLESSIQPMRYKAEAGMMPKRGFIPDGLFHGTHHHKGEDETGLVGRGRRYDQEENEDERGVTVDRTGDSEDWREDGWTRL